MVGRYIDLCKITLKLSDTTNVKVLHNIAVKNKVDAVTFFIDSNNVFVAFESFINNSIVLHRIKCKVVNIRVMDTNNAQYDVMVDNRKFISEENNKAVSMKDIKDLFSMYPSALLDNIDKKTYIRFASTTNILKALSLFSNQEVTLSVDENIELTEGMTRLVINRPRTVVDFEDYLTPFCNIRWDKINTVDVSEIAKALLKTKDAVYKMYIAIEDGKVYSHNTSFLIERKSSNVNGKYVLPYTTIETIKLLPQKADTYIGRIDDTLTVYSSDTYVSWNIGKQNNGISNLISMLNKDNFIRIATINKEEWNKVVILKDYSDVDADQDITISIKNRRILAKKGENITNLSANSANSDVSFKVGIDSLLIAKDLAGTTPLLYIDKTGKDNVLVFYNEMLVVIATSDLKVEAVEAYPRTLNDVINSANKRNQQNNIKPNNISLDNTRLKDIETVVEDDIDVTADDLDFSNISDMDFSLGINKIAETDNNKEINEEFGDLDLIPPTFVMPELPK